MSQERVLRSVLVRLWPALLAVVLTWPLLTRPGHPLARDLVFVPRQPLTDASVGLGSTAPRAVPLDAVVSLVSTVVDGGLLARLVLPLTLAAAGWGVQRLLVDLGTVGTVGRLAAGGFAVWNPYVVERLALGQWALLLGYAALPWLVVAGARFRRQGRWRDLGVVVSWLAVASLTPTGGLLGCTVAMCAGASRRSRTGLLVAAAVVLQLPWLLPSFVGSSGRRSDPAGVAVFASAADGPGGVVVSLLGLGGIWDADSVPATRETWWTPVVALVVAVVLVAGWRRLGESESHERRRLVAPAALGFLLAALVAVPGGGTALRWLVDTVPGAGLLRDGQKFLAPFAVLVACALGLAAHAAATAMAGRGTELAVTAAVLLVPLPLVLLPDAPFTTGPTVTPVRYPDGFDRVDRVLDRAGPGDLAVLPWRSYRGFSWGNGLTSSDPALRWFDRPVLADDALRVGDRVVAGESPRLRRLGEDLADGPPAEALRRNGVRWALVQRDDPDAERLDLDGLEQVYADDDLALLEVPDPARVQGGPSSSARAVVGAADLLAAGVAITALLGCAVAGVTSRRGTARRRTRNSAAMPPR